MVPTYSHLHSDLIENILPCPAWYVGHISGGILSSPCWCPFTSNVLRMTLTCQKCWLTQSLSRRCWRGYANHGVYELLHETRAKFGRNHPFILLAREPTQSSWKPQTVFLSYGMRKCRTELRNYDWLGLLCQDLYVCFNCLFNGTADSFHFPWGHLQTGERVWRVSYSLCQQRRLKLSRYYDKNYVTFTQGFGIESKY